MSPTPDSAIVYAAAGIVRRADGSLLMQQRTAKQSYAGYWEFPGGKVAAGETAEFAMRRELMEEVGLTAIRVRRFVRRQWTQASGKIVLVDFFIVDEYEGEPQSREGQPLVWADLADLPSPLLPANLVLCHWLQLPPFCLITAAEYIGEQRMLSCIDNMLTDANAAKHFIVLRDKTLATRKSFAAKVLELSRKHNVMVFAADDEELAKQMDGLHLSSSALLSCTTRPPFSWVGASCHNAAELSHATLLGLDYAFLSPVCHSKSHPETTPLGWEKFSALSLNAGLPIIALGGLGTNDLAQVQKHHGNGVAFMRDAW